MPNNSLSLKAMFPELPDIQLENSPEIKDTSFFDGASQEQFVKTMRHLVQTIIDQRYELQIAQDELDELKHERDSLKGDLRACRTALQIIRVGQPYLPPKKVE